MNGWLADKRLLLWWEQMAYLIQQLLLNTPSADRILFHSIQLIGINGHCDHSFEQIVPVFSSSNAYLILFRTVKSDSLKNSMPIKWWSSSLFDALRILKS